MVTLMTSYTLIINRPVTPPMMNTATAVIATFIAITAMSENFNFSILPPFKDYVVKIKKPEIIILYSVSFVKPFSKKIARGNAGYYAMIKARKE